MLYELSSEATQLGAGQFVIAVLPLALILCKIKAGYKTSIEKVFDHWFFINDLKIYAASQDQLDFLIHDVIVFSKPKVIKLLFGLDKWAALKVKGTTAQQWDRTSRQDEGPAKMRKTSL